MKSRIIILIGVISAFSPIYGDDFEPETVDKNMFSALTAQSPFNRSLNLSGSLILTGIAMIEDKQVATLLDTSTKQSYVVSDEPNQHGWKMIELNQNSDLERVTARISVGGELVSIRYSETKLKPGETRPGGGSPQSSERERGSGRSKRGGLSDDLRKKMGEMSDEQRGKFFNKMRELHEKNPEMSSEDRQAAARKFIEKAGRKEK